ncbi:ribonuclease E activity regulator RraA [Halobacillus karajensis]|uniref:4-hydroxy-4-methyl-2-oxoglutarate aldolase n=1 Tax=Halobacillus karajensis TaxID=195088 RepID=A0A059NYT5_9BACI|nr:ribonuclease E activity regulator RraA [Halobacillus karajensis]CDQ18512.1 Putative regulator of ribonuclease activity [Halobacillus karajensis]CDQ23416.1 Putative regulator of ribonuclease activity [Halobacillus karajensis]CDQ26898.1 Putative regulator of ribonuclease activity [Halobacillus karajensis]
MSIKTADLCDHYPDQVTIVDPSFRSFGQRKSFSGPISTVKVKDDNVLVRKALETIPAGNVLVVDGIASKNCALLGGNLAEIAAERGLGGIIINGYIRDFMEVCETDIGVMALGTIPLKSQKEGKGQENIPLAFGNALWNPGDYVYVDEDGIILASEKLIIDS